MKIGFLIPCYNIENIINLTNILSLIELNRKLHFCFINNGSSDNTLGLLEYLKGKSKVQINVLDIKKRKKLSAVAKAGIRFLNSTEQFKYILSMSLDFSLGFEELMHIIQLRSLKRPDYINTSYSLRVGIDINFKEL